MRLLKKLTATSLAAIMLMAGLYIGAPKAYAEPVAETEQDGKFFAGYYEDEERTIPSVAETAYEKWVDTGILNVKMQTRLVDGKIDIRLLSTVDTLNYFKVGFRISFDKNGDGAFSAGEVTTWDSTSVTQRITANNSSFVYRYSPKVIDTDSEYFITGILKGIPESNWDKMFLVEPFWITVDNTKVFGQSRWFTVNDLQIGSTNINLSAKMDESDFDSASVSGIDGASIRSSYYDGKYGHFNLTVADRTALASVTPVTIGGTTVYYRNLQNTAAEDTSWYTVPNAAGETEFVVATAADMYGINNYETSFGGKTIYLVSDLELNDVSRVNWTTGAADTGYTPTQWQRIGRINYAFAGTFDGQGHTISGLYLTDTSGSANNVLGLFGRTYGGAVRNVSLTNSYIQTASEGVGSIVGQVENGTILSNLYSNATVRGSRAFIGGLFGKIMSGRVEANRCWFDGKIVSTSSGNSRGFVGGIAAYQYGSSGAVFSMNSCLYTGSIDVSAMSQTNTSAYGVAGLLAVRGSLVIVTDCAVLGTVTTGPSSGYTASYVGSADANTKSLLGIDNYRIASGWTGNYHGSQIYFGKTDVSAANVTGAAARSTMSALDWAGIWQTRDGKYPGLNMDAGIEDTYKDISWYNDSDTSFTLDSIQDLRGLARLVNSGITFDGKTITLTSDVTLNTGSAADWATEAPQYTWEPIGGNPNTFKGTFDGGMHTISGLYTASGARQGLFGLTIGATIRNIKLTNSYIGATGQWVGSIVGQGSGTLTNLYSDAIVTTSGAMVGGIVGANDDANKLNLSLENCWFAGKLSNTHSAGGNSGAFAGGLVGYLGVGVNTINNCLVTGTIDISSFVHSGGGNPKTGGLVGVNSTPSSTTITNTAYLGVFIPGDNANKTGLYSLVGDVSQRTLNGSNIYAMVDNHFVAGGYSNINSGFSVSYTNLGGTYPTDASAQTRMPNLDWENTWQVRPGKLPALAIFAE